MTTEQLWPCRLFEDAAASGPWNMAVDEILLQSAAEGRFSVRLYSWEEPTVSLGYFQAYADRQLHPPSRACACVRRASGGGAIVHDGDLTYSIALPAGHPFAVNHLHLYQVTHLAWADALCESGLEATVVQPSATGLNLRREPFLCFQRNAVHDVQVKGRKVVGSSQRRQKGAVLQHGSLLCKTSNRAPELIGLDELGVFARQTDLIRQIWLRKLGEGLRLAYEPCTLAGDEVERLPGSTAKFSDFGWTARR